MKHSVSALGILLAGLLVISGCTSEAELQTSYDAGHKDGYDVGHASGLTESQKHVDALEASLTQAESRGETLRHDLEQTTQELTEIREGHILHNPTHTELLDFLEYIRTQGMGQGITSREMLWIDSAQPAAGIDRMAQERGIRCALVIIRLSKMPWFLVAFDTTDKGRVYVDASNVSLVELRKEMKYFSDNSLPTVTAIDDRVIDIILSW
ncbi:hypothetical protein ACFLVX_05585 [Chloroflexota bacterium]